MIAIDDEEGCSITMVAKLICFVNILCQLLIPKHSSIARMNYAGGDLVFCFRKTAARVSKQRYLILALFGPAALRSILAVAVSYHMAKPSARVRELLHSSTAIRLLRPDMFPNQPAATRCTMNASKKLGKHYRVPRSTRRS